MEASTLQNLHINFCVSKKYFDHCKTKKFSFLKWKIISKVIIFYRIFKNCWSLGAALIYASSGSNFGSGQIMRLPALRLQLRLPSPIRNHKTNDESVSIIAYKIEKNLFSVEGYGVIKKISPQNISTVSKMFIFLKKMQISLSSK